MLLVAGALPKRPPGLAAVLPNNGALLLPPSSPVPSVGAAACVLNPPKAGAAAGLLKLLLKSDGCWAVCPKPKEVLAAGAGAPNDPFLLEKGMY